MTLFVFYRALPLTIMTDVVSNKLMWSDIMPENQNNGWNPRNKKDVLVMRHSPQTQFFTLDVSEPISLFAEHKINGYEAMCRVIKLMGHDPDGQIKTKTFSSKNGDQIHFVETPSLMTSGVSETGDFNFAALFAISNRDLETAYNTFFTKMLYAPSNIALAQGHSGKIDTCLTILTGNDCESYTLTGLTPTPPVPREKVNPGKQNIPT